MKNINLNKFKQAKAKFLLENGGEIVGTDVDENNRLIYIIREKNNLRASYASDERASKSIPIESSQGTTIHIDRKP